MLSSLISSLVLASTCFAHGDHSQKPIVDPNADWITRHMAEEHHIASWDPDSIFTLHDFDNDGFWKPHELQRMYGFMDPSNKDMAAERREQLTHQLLAMLDTDGDGVVSRHEWLSFVHQGHTLPDLGTGPGHHGDDEYEYEIHHWEKYHDENTRLEDLTHPEDIEHFKMHESMERAAEELEAMEKRPIIEENIPIKFRRS